MFITILLWIIWFMMLFVSIYMLWRNQKSWSVISLAIFILITTYMIQGEYMITVLLDPTIVEAMFVLAVSSLTCSMAWMAFMLFMRRKPEGFTGDQPKSASAPFDQDA